MSKKSKIMYCSLLVVNIVTFILDLTPLPFPFFKISFGVTLVLMGVLLIARAIRLKIDSSLFIGTMLLLFGGLNLLSFFGSRYFNLNINLLWPYYLLAISVASFATAVNFKDKFQLKLGTLFLGFGIITALFVYKLINLVWFVVLMVACFIVYFVINIILNNKGRGKNG